MRSPRSRCARFCLGLAALVIACSGEKPRDLPLVAPAPPSPNVTDPAPAADPMPPRSRCEAPNGPPVLAAPETYVYAGIASFVQPGKMRADGAVERVRRPTGDGNYHVLTLGPDGSAEGMFFTARRGEPPQFSSTPAACWRWLDEPGASARRLALSIGQESMELVRSAGALARVEKHDKLRTQRMYDQVAALETDASCATVADPSIFTQVASEHGAAFVAGLDSGIRAVILERSGRARAFSIATRDAKLSWSAADGCWTKSAEGVRIATREFRVTGAGLRELGVDTEYQRAEH